MSQGFKVLVGFDGFTDAIYRVVEERKNATEALYFPTIHGFASRLDKAAQVSCNIELVLQEKRLGGNAPLMAKALIDLGAEVSFIGTIGEPHIEPLFQDFAHKCANVYSLAPSGQSDALEFQDGKIILGKHGAILHVSEKTLLEKVGAALGPLWEESDLIAMVNWTMLPYMNAIWRYLQSHYSRSGKLFFFDLADPSKRSAEDLHEALTLIAGFNQAILGLNEAEHLQLVKLFGENFSQKFGLTEIVVHSKTRAAVLTPGQKWEISNPLIMNPVTTTGAGDNFNAGYCFARLQGFDYTKSLQRACTLARQYITHVAK